MAEAAPVAAPQQPKSGTSKVIAWVLGIILGVIVLVGVGIWALVYFIALAPLDAASNSATRVIELVRDGKTEEAYNLTYSDFKNATSLSEWQQFVNSYPVLVANKSVNFTDKEYKNDNADVFGAIEARDGTKAQIHMILVKQGDEWKVKGLELLPAGTVRPTPAL